MDLYNPLCNFCASLIDEDQVEDIVQQVFLTIWKNRNQTDHIDSLRHYLFRSVKNEALKFKKKQIRDKENHEKYLKQHVDDNDNMSEVSQEYMLKELINKSIRQLPPKSRKIFDLHKKEGLTYSEIAEHLGLSVKTIETSMSRTYKRIRSTCSEYLNKDHY